MRDVHIGVGTLFFFFVKSNTAIGNNNCHFLDTPCVISDKYVNVDNGNPVWEKKKQREYFTSQRMNMIFCACVKVAALLFIEFLL